MSILFNIILPIFDDIFPADPTSGHLHQHPATQRGVRTQRRWKERRGEVGHGAAEQEGDAGLGKWGMTGVDMGNIMEYL